MMVKKASDALVVYAVAPGALFVSQPNHSRPDQVAEIAAQGGNMEWMNQIADRGVVAFVEHLGASCDHPTPMSPMLIGEFVGLEQSSSNEKGNILVPQFGDGTALP